jgi:hypothetical protein
MKSCAIGSTPWDEPVIVTAGPKGTITSRSRRQRGPGVPPTGVAVLEIVVMCGVGRPVACGVPDQCLGCEQ